MFEHHDPKARNGILAVIAQCLLALVGGYTLAARLVPGDSAWELVGAVGMFAAVVASHASAFGFALLLAPVLFVKAAASYARDGELLGTAQPTRAERVFGGATMLVSTGVMLGVSAATALVLWLATNGTSLVAAIGGFLLLGALLAALMPKAVHALG